MILSRGPETKHIKKSSTVLKVIFTIYDFEMATHYLNTSNEYYF